MTNSTIYSISKVIVAVCVMGIFAGCKKYLDIEPAPNILENADVFTNDKTATAAVLGVYNNLRGATRHFSNGGLGIYAGLSADEIFNNTSSPFYDGFKNNALTAKTSGVFTNIWRVAYITVYRANAIIEGLNNSVGVTESVKKQLIGEMKFVRAWSYFTLVNLFGDVPLVLTTDYQINAIMPRTPSAQVYAQILTDLKEAQALLIPVYPSAEKARPNLYTATALLARVYLYQKEWAKAESEATSVINSGKYVLVQNLGAVFLRNSNETIWELAHDNANTNPGSLFLASNAPLRITDSLFGAFDAIDKRKTTWIKTGNNGVPPRYPAKYVEKSTTTPVREYQVVFRLAEQFLIRAEARAMQNNFAGAKSDIDSIRLRAGLVSLPVNSEAEAMLIIEKERRKELFTEWGDRWLDLRRWGKLDAVMQAFKGALWNSYDSLYPIPESELLYNPFLIQNPGYQ